VRATPRPLIKGLPLLGWNQKYAVYDSAVLTVELDVKMATLAGLAPATQEERSGFHALLLSYRALKISGARLDLKPKHTIVALPINRSSTAGITPAQDLSWLNYTPRSLCRGERPTLQPRFYILRAFANFSIKTRSYTAAKLFIELTDSWLRILALASCIAQSFFYGYYRTMSDLIKKHVNYKTNQSKRYSLALSLSGGAKVSFRAEKEMLEKMEQIKKKLNLDSRQQILEFLVLDYKLNS